MDLLQTYKPFCVAVNMAAADASKTLVAAVTGKSIVVTKLTAHVFTAAAQLVTVAAGTTTVGKVAVSLPIGVYMLVDTETGLVGQSGSALIATPAAAGPGVFFVVEGYYLPS